MNEGGYRYRTHFHKTGDLRYIGHLDLHRSLERTLRRAGLPLEYSKGFNPRVRLNLCTALPLGCSSSAEIADFWLQEGLETDVVGEALRSAAPPGLEFISVEKIERKSPSLQSQITGATYRVELSDAVDDTQLEQRVGELLLAEEMIRTRRGKTYDLRPLVQSLETIKNHPQPPSLRMVLAVGEGRTGRPEEVLLAIGLDPADASIERIALSLSEQDT